MKLLCTENNHFSLNQAITTIILLVVYVNTFYFSHSWERGLIRRRDLIEEGGTLIIIKNGIIF